MNRHAVPLPSPYNDAAGVLLRETFAILLLVLTLPLLVLGAAASMPLLLLMGLAEVVRNVYVSTRNHQPESR